MMDQQETNHAIELRVVALETRVIAMNREIAENTLVTNLIKNDTEELITILKGLKAFSKIATWAGGVAAAGTASYAALRGFK